MTYLVFAKELNVGVCAKTLTFPFPLRSSSALHEVKHPKVIGRDGWERDATSMQKNFPKEFWGSTLNLN